MVKAINYAINRQAILKVQASGYGAIAYQPFPKGFVGYSPKLANQYPYNPTLAKQLFAPAGYTNGLKITLTAPASTSSLAEQIQGQLAQVGITATIGTSPPAPGPSTSTWTRPSRSRSTGRPGGCRRWRCSTSSTASRA